MIRSVSSFRFPVTNAGTFETSPPFRARLSLQGVIRLQTGNRQQKTEKRQGLTLIEVILGLAIMLIALVAIGRLVDIGTDSGFEARMTARGNRLAEVKMAEVEAGAIALDSTSEGTFEEEPAWSWRVSPEPQGPANLYLVTVTVSRDNSGRVFEISHSQYLVDPSAVGSAAQAEKPDDAGGDSGGTMP